MGGAHVVGPNAVQALARPRDLRHGPCRAHAISDDDPALASGGDILSFRVFSEGLSVVVLR